MVCKWVISWATAGEFIKRRHSPRSMEIRRFLLPRVTHFNLFRSFAASTFPSNGPRRGCSAIHARVWWNRKNNGILIYIFPDFHQPAPVASAALKGFNPRWPVRVASTRCKHLEWANVLCTVPLSWVQSFNQYAKFIWKWLLWNKDVRWRRSGEK